MTEEEYRSHEMIGNALMLVMLIVFSHQYCVIASNCNNNFGRLYYICNSCKIIEGRYKSHKTVGKASMLVIAFSITKVVISKIESNLI